MELTAPKSNKMPPYGVSTAVKPSLTLGGQALRTFLVNQCQRDLIGRKIG